MGSAWYTPPFNQASTIQANVRDLGRNGGNHGARGDQLLPHRIDLEIHAFEGVRAQKGHVARLGEYDEVRRLRPAGSDERVADVPVNAAAVGQDKTLFPLYDDAKPFKDIARNPGILAPRVYQRVRQRLRSPAPFHILDFDRRAKQSHVVHGNTLLPERTDPFIALGAQFTRSARGPSGPSPSMIARSESWTLMIRFGCASSSGAVAKWR